MNAKQSPRTTNSRQHERPLPKGGGLFPICLMAVAGLGLVQYLTLMCRTLFAALLACIPTANALAHPHIFVEVSMAVIFEGDAPAAVRLEWTYDDYFSLLLTTDLGIDLDGDATLTPQEADILSEAVRAWPAGYEGDLEVSQAGRVVVLGPRTDHFATFVDGIVREVHTRPLTGQVDGGMPLIVRAFDPSHYVAYDVTGAITIEGRDGCSSALQSPDIAAASALVSDLLGGRSADEVGPDEAFPEVGDLFAQTVTITCNG